MNMIDDSLFGSCDAVKEGLTYLAYFQQELINQIPSLFLTEMKKIANKSTRTFEVDTSKNLLEQEMSEDCKDFLALVHYLFFATPEEKKELAEIWRKNAGQ